MILGVLPTYQYIATGSTITNAATTGCLVTLAASAYMMMDMGDVALLTVALWKPATNNAT